MRINDVAYTAIGVAPEGFQGTGVTVGHLWLPLNMSGTVRARAAAPATSILEKRGGGWLVMGGRLKPDVTLEAAEAELATISRDLQREYPGDMEHRELRVIASSALPGNRGVIAGFMILLLVIVGLVLLVACANVSGVLLSRAVTRRREMAVRLAMGAGRGRLVRQLLIETMVLFLVGGVDRRRARLCHDRARGLVASVAAVPGRRVARDRPPRDRVDHRPVSSFLFLLIPPFSPPPDNEVGVTVPGPNWVEQFEPDWNIVEPGYFATLRIPLIAGRDSTDSDREGTQPVAIVGEAAAKFFWPGKDPIGQQILQHVGGRNGLPEERSRSRSAAPRRCARSPAWLRATARCAARSTPIR